MYEWVDVGDLIEGHRKRGVELAAIKAAYKAATYDKRRCTIESARALRFLRDVKGMKLSPRQEGIIDTWADQEIDGDPIIE